MTEPTDKLAQALHDAATSLETISRLAGKAYYITDGGPIPTYMGHHDEVRAYASARASVARAELAQASAAHGAEKAESLTPFAWATFDGEGSYDLRLYEDNEAYRDEFIERNSEQFASWVLPLYHHLATAAPVAVPLTDAEIEPIYEDNSYGSFNGAPQNPDWVGFARAIERTLAARWGVKLEGGEA